MRYSAKAKMEKSSTTPYINATSRSTRSTMSRLSVSIRDLFDFSNFTKSVLANDDVYDVVLLNIKTAVTSATSGYLEEINDIPYLDFSKPWWLENSVTESSIMNRSYFAVGDINLASYESTPVIFFNKQMTEANNITDLYEVVDRGEWTYDKMLEYMFRRRFRSGWQ